MPGLLYPVIYGAQSFVIPDLNGKVMIVTGGSSGLGLHTIIHLVRAGAKVYMAARSETKVKAALPQIAKMNLCGQVVWLRVDMTDFEGVRAAALEFSAKERRLDVLFLNAGITGPNKATVDADGLESTIKTNHCGPFLLAHLLLSKLQKSADPRIVLTASMYYKYFKATPDSFSSVAEVNQIGTRTGQRYSQSKLSNVLFAVQASKEWPNILTNACHPGFVATDMLQAVGTRYGGSLGMMLMKG